MIRAPSRKSKNFLHKTFALSALLLTVAAVHTNSNKQKSIYEIKAHKEPVLTSTLDQNSGGLSATPTQLDGKNKLNPDNKLEKLSAKKNNQKVQKEFVQSQALIGSQKQISEFVNTNVEVNKSSSVFDSNEDLNYRQKFETKRFNPAPTTYNPSAPVADVKHKQKHIPRWTQDQIDTVLISIFVPVVLLALLIPYMIYCKTDEKLKQHINRRLLSDAREQNLLQQNLKEKKDEIFGSGKYSGGRSSSGGRYSFRAFQNTDDGQNDGGELSDCIFNDENCFNEDSAFNQGIHTFKNEILENEFLENDVSDDEYHKNYDHQIIQKSLKNDVLQNDVLEIEVQKSLENSEIDDDILENAILDNEVLEPAEHD